MSNFFMSRREATLLTADNTLKFMIKELDVQDCYLAKDLKNALIERIYQRRKKDLIGLLRFLDNPQSLKSDMDNDLFSIPSKTVMINLAFEITGQLFPIIENIAKVGDIDRKLNYSIININQSSESMGARLEKFVKKEMTLKSSAINQPCVKNSVCLKLLIKDRII